MKKSRGKFGIQIPLNTRQALMFDQQNNNNKWETAIAKEMTVLDQLNCFRYHPSHKRFPRSQGWQFASVHMISDIKAQYLRHKARLVVRGHMIDSSMHNTYSSNVQNLSVRLLMLVAAKAGLSLAACDIGNAFPTAPCKEKVWSLAGPEFLNREGCKIEVIQALYWLATSSWAFHESLADCLRRMGFKPTRADPDLWYIKSNDHDWYDYVATHVDDVIVAAMRPMTYISYLEQEFVLRNKEVSPEYYLGTNLKRILNKYIHVSSSKYITDFLSN